MVDGFVYFAVQVVLHFSSYRPTAETTSAEVSSVKHILSMLQGLSSVTPVAWKARYISLLRPFNREISTYFQYKISANGRNRLSSWKMTIIGWNFFSSTGFPLLDRTSVASSQVSFFFFFLGLSTSANARPQATHQFLQLLSAIRFVNTFYSLVTKVVVWQMWECFVSRLSRVEERKEFQPSIVIFQGDYPVAAIS